MVSARCRLCYIKGLSQDVLFNLGFVAQFLLGVDVHRNLQEGLVKHGNTTLETPSHGRLVGTQVVRILKILDSLQRLEVESIRRGRLVKVQVALQYFFIIIIFLGGSIVNFKKENLNFKGTAKDLIGALSRQDCLDSGRLDLAREQVHGSGGANGRDVVRLEVVDDVVDGIKALLHGEMVLVVDGADKLGHLLGKLEIGRVLEADRERVQSRPPCLALLVVFDAFACVALGN